MKCAFCNKTFKVKDRLFAGGEWATEGFVCTIFHEACFWNHVEKVLKEKRNESTRET